jgi:hypothetical protein
MRILALLTLLGISSLHSHIGDVEIGARAIGAGKACVTLLEGSEAIFWNPASLISETEVDIYSVYEMPYSLREFMRGAVSIKLGDRKKAFGVGLRIKNLRDVFNESNFILGFARRVKFLSIGGNFRYIVISATDGNGNNYAERNWTFDMGILVEIRNFRLSYSYFDLIKPNMSLLGNDEPSISTQRIGFGLRRPSNVIWLLSIEDHGYGFNIYRIGVEAWFTRGFSARFGIDERYPTVGFGLREKNWELDFGTRSHRYLGNTYSISFRVFDFF